MIFIHDLLYVPMKMFSKEEFGNCFKIKSFVMFLYWKMETSTFGALVPFEFRSRLDGI